MKELANILSITPKQVLQTYFLWKATQAFASDIEADAVKPYMRFSNELQGKVSIFSSFDYYLLTVSRTLTRPQNDGEPASATLTTALAGS